MKDRGGQLRGPVVAFLVLTWLFFGLRILVRLRTMRKLLLDDWLLSISMIFFSTMGGLYLTSVFWGFGKHIIDLDVKSQKNALQAWFYTSIFATICPCLLRLAAGCHILRHASKHWQRSVVYVGCSVNVLYSFFLVFVLIFRCKPVNWFWERSEAIEVENGANIQGVCRPNLAKNGMYAESVMSALVDWSFASLPLILMRKVDMGKVQRAALSIVILLGQAAGFVIIARLPAYRGLTIHADYTYSTIPIGVLTTTESSLLILALCLATLSPLLPTPKSLKQNSRMARWDLESESALRGIPLERNLGTTTVIESTAKGETYKGDSVSRKGSVIKVPVKAKTKSGFTSSDTLVQVLENGNVKTWDSGIVKTTDVVTFSDDDLSSKAAQQPATSLTR